jgi:hypothetical protein
MFFIEGAKMKINGGIANNDQGLGQIHRARFRKWCESAMASFAIVASFNSFAAEKTYKKSQKWQEIEPLQ